MCFKRREKKREGKGEEWGRIVWMARGKGRVHSWSCSTLSDRKREERRSIMQAPDTRGEACSSQEWHSVWKRRGGSFPHFQLALSILSQLISPPPLLVCPCQGLKMHAACWLSVCLPGGDRCWLVGGGSPGDGLWVFTLRRCHLCGLVLVTLGLFFFLQRPD